ncbi:MAG TPA: glycoside hydrolase family 31 protein [Terriglobia bacterium]|nr:glycoside hydrolase family 31 protein [Terriglobia bacterium]
MLIKRCALPGVVLFLIFTSASYVGAQWIPPDPVTEVEKRSDSVLFTMKSGVLWIQVCADSIIRVRYSPTSSFPAAPDYVVTKTKWPEIPWTMQSTDKDVTLSTARMKVTVARNNGAVEYSDADGVKLVQEATRTLAPSKVNGEDTNRAESFFSIYGSEEAFYGLGQHQAGVWNYRGESVDLSQENTEIAVPLWLSSKGYGIFWNNTSRSIFNNRFVHSLYVSSEVADEIDYYFLYGPEFDKIIAGYRELTGAAPMFGKWAYGFWQCKNRYKTQDEILGVAHKYRELKIPVDNIVQDWFWWTTTGEFKFNKNYPDPKGMIDDLHRNNFHLMISIWPYFYPGSTTYADMDKRGYFIDRTKAVSFHPLGNALYDATNPQAAAYYWNLVDQSLFKIGADAWWMDTDEPETEGQEENILLGHKLAIGSGDRYANIFPLLDTATVYHGQRNETDRKRVFILSRSAFAGNQRNAVTAWSGDVLSDFESFKRQIPAGLNFALSGIPYWTTDIGGFFIGNPNDPAYRELFVRWFQFGAFCPIFRVHGTRTTNENELWSYGPEAQKILTSFDRLRYRLLPYIYSLAWKTTSESYTLMRPLPMDFRLDMRAQNIGDQFMFGPALLVNPVTEPAATVRHLYLPKAKWYDFWKGTEAEGGKSVDSPAPLERIPLFVRAGSIIPMGPDLQYSTQAPADPIELRVYRGADGDFTIYEDENDNYNYEKGVHATIPLHWDDAQNRLTIGERRGSFPGMLEKRTFRIVMVGPNHGTGIDPAAQADKVVEYSGKQIRAGL